MFFYNYVFGTTEFTCIRAKGCSHEFLMIFSSFTGHSSNEGDMKGSIFRLAKKNNYMTLLSADNPHMITAGKGVEVDHSSLPFFRVLKK